MEIGAVKQAFNNEVILLKKKLNQAKLHVIHKLTRKAKILNEKKAPDDQKDKLQRKAKSAVTEVLIIKKITARHIAKFIITHTGELKDYLNKPNVDHNKACARLLLHKSLQDKYKLIRGKFSSIPLKDLFMSRQERRKLKKEEKMKNKSKKKKRNQNIVNSEGDWDVEDIERPVVSKDDKMRLSIDNENEMDSDEKEYDSDVSEIEPELDGHKNEDSNIYDNEKEYFNNRNEVSSSDGDENMSMNDGSQDSGSDCEKRYYNGDDSEVSNLDDELNQNPDKNFELESKILSELENFKSNIVMKTSKDKSTISNKTTIANIKNNKAILQNNSKIKEKKSKDNKKNLSEKILLRKFKKDSADTSVHDNKVADPFFITSTGENYMSVVEPRAPDEFKEIHKQGNRKQRRAAMFGHAPKVKPRNNFENKVMNRFENNKGKFRDCRFDKFENNNQRIRNDSVNNDEKPEKLHPSWEAKKRQCSILPFQGKKIVFDET